MEKCTQEHFNNADKDLFHNLSLNSTYCMPKHFSTELMNNGTYEKYGKIRLSYCKVEKNN